MENRISTSIQYQFTNVIFFDELFTIIAKTIKLKPEYAVLFYCLHRQELQYAVLFFEYPAEVPGLPFSIPKWSVPVTQKDYSCYFQEYQQPLH